MAVFQEGQISLPLSYSGTAFLSRGNGRESEKEGAQAKSEREEQRTALTTPVSDPVASLRRATTRPRYTSLTPRISALAKELVSAQEGRRSTSDSVSLADSLPRARRPHTQAPPVTEEVAHTTQTSEGPKESQKQTEERTKTRVQTQRTAEDGELFLLALLLLLLLREGAEGGILGALGTLFYLLLE